MEALENRWLPSDVPFAIMPPISTTGDGAWSVAVGDVDGDGDLDALSGSYKDDKVAWYENAAGDGTSWTPHAISTSADVVRSVAVGDVDGDGDLDALSVSSGDHRIAWYENTAGDGSAWTARTIFTRVYGDNQGLAVGDVDGDSDLDVLAATFDLTSTVFWFENTAGNGSAWAERTLISNTPEYPLAVTIADLDGDGDGDALFGFISHNGVSWYENTAGNGSVWTKRTIDLKDTPTSVAVADVDGDGDPDTLATFYYPSEVAWYENTAGNGTSWTKRTITTSANFARSVAVGDVDGDGDLDALSASEYDDKIAWYENTAGNGTAWTARTITTNADRAMSVAVGDMDGDGDLDALSASPSDDKVAWYRNDTVAQFRLTTESTSPAILGDAEAEDLLRITITHLGQPGNPDLELASLVLRFEETAGDALTTAKVNALIDTLFVYADADGNGTFDGAIDTLVTSVSSLSLAAGLQTVPFVDGDAKVQVSVGNPRKYFVVAQLTPGADSQAPNHFRVSHVTNGATRTRAEDRTTDTGLRLELVADVASGPVTAADTIAVTGDVGPDALVITASSPSSGGYTLNGGGPVFFGGISGFSFAGLGGDDTLTIHNPAGALFAPTNGISYDGGGQSGDSLLLDGGGGVTFSETYAVGPAADAGTLTTTGAGWTQTIAFTGLAPITDTVAVGTLTIKGSVANDTINIVDGPVVGTDQTLEMNFNGAFELIRLARKATVVVSGGQGSDTFLVNTALAGSGLSGLTLKGDSGNDTFHFVASVGGVTYAVQGSSQTTQDRLVIAADASFTLKNTSLAMSTGVSISVGGLERAELTGGPGANTFTVSGWSGFTHLDGQGGSADRLVSANDADFTLTDTAMIRSTGGAFTLAGIEKATLGGGPGNNTFTVTGWTGTATLNGQGGSDKVVSSGNADFTLDDTSLTVSGAGTFTLSSIERAGLTGGPGNNSLMAAAFTGTATLDGAGGNDIVVGGAGGDNLLGGYGRDLLIGRSGTDTLNGGGGDDILIGGTTAFDSNRAALDALMAEWSRTSVSYLRRIDHLTGEAGGGLNGGTFLNVTTVSDDVGIADLISGGTNLDWFFQSANDSINDLNLGGPETVTAV